MRKRQIGENNIKMEAAEKKAVCVRLLTAKADGRRSIMVIFFISEAATVELTGEHNCYDQDSIYCAAFCIA